MGEKKGTIAIVGGTVWVLKNLTPSLLQKFLSSSSECRFGTHCPFLNDRDIIIIFFESPGDHAVVAPQSRKRSQG